MVPPLARPGRALPLAGLLLLALVPAPRALASATQITIMQDDKEIVATTGAHRDMRLAEMKALGADVVKIRLDWRGVAPSPKSKTKPAGFVGDDSTKYPPQAFATYDAAIRAIVAHGLRPHVLLGGASPDWAGGKNGRGGRPGPTEFGPFVRAGAP